MKVYYFSWIREKVGRSFDEIKLPLNVSTVADLIAHLRTLGSGYQEAFINPDFIRVAKNHEHVDKNQTISNNDEIGFFPPITGG